jgi:hypothetical protein
VLPIFRTNHTAKAIFGAGAAALTLFILAAPAWADNARLPYSQLYYTQKAQLELNRTHTNLLVMLTMQSTLPDVKTASLNVYIDSKSGKIPIPIGPVGDFAIPLRDDLLAENPWVVTDQPKGTMKLNWEGALILGHLANPVHYSRLMQPVRDYEVVQEQMRRYFPNSPRLATTGLKLAFPDAQKKAVAVIHARDGDRKLVANSQGEIIIPLTTDLLEEDPEITLSDVPGVVGIASHQSGD